jgi:hypothetical protein
LPAIEESPLIRRRLLGRGKPPIGSLKPASLPTIPMQKPAGTGRNLVIRASRQVEKSTYLVNTIIHEACTNSHRLLDPTQLWVLPSVDLFQRMSFVFRLFHGGLGSVNHFLGNVLKLPTVTEPP